MRQLLGVLACLAVGAAVLPVVRASAHPSIYQPYTAVLRGQDEVGKDGSPEAGDPAAVGAATVMIDHSKLCFGITVGGLSKPSEARIHKGTARANGPAVVTLVKPEHGDPGASSGCLTSPDDQTSELFQDILSYPENYYVNILTKEYPDGAIRGQLSKQPYRR